MYSMPIQMHTENKQVNNLFLSSREIFSQQSIFFSFSKQQKEMSNKWKSIFNTKLLTQALILLVYIIDWMMYNNITSVLQ